MSELHNDPPNCRYRRRYADPRLRPSNRRVDPLLEHVRWRVEQVGRFIDELEAERGGEVVLAAEAILQTGRAGPMRGDPDE